MLVKCCLPLSLAEHEGFREFCECLESSYKPPFRKTIKHSILPDMRKEVEKKIKLELDQLETVYIGLDGWSDKIQRCFNGYIAQGINSDCKSIISLSLS
jgi:hypothetical protein